MGLLGLLLVYSTRHRLDELRNQLAQWAFLILILSVLGGGLGIDHAAHAGGFITGCLIGFTVRPYLTSAAAARWRFPGYLVATAFIVSLGIGIWGYFQAPFWDSTP
jgi:membrane associated rhomboid family serine protease